MVCGFFLGHVLPPTRTGLRADEAGLLFLLVRTGHDGRCATDRRLLARLGVRTLAVSGLGLAAAGMAIPALSLPRGMGSDRSRDRGGRHRRTVRGRLPQPLWGRSPRTRQESPPGSSALRTSWVPPSAPRSSQCGRGSVSPAPRTTGSPVGSPLPQSLPQRRLSITPCSPGSPARRAGVDSAGCPLAIDKEVAGAG